MLEIAALLAFFLGFALLHAAEPKRRAAMPLRALTLSGAAYRTSALASASFGVWSWLRADSVAGALLIAIPALAVAATLFVLLAALWPRALWISAFCCAPLIVFLTLIGTHS